MALNLSMRRGNRINGENILPGTKFGLKYKSAKRHSQRHVCIFGDILLFSFHICVYHLFYDDILFLIDSEDVYKYVQIFCRFQLFLFVLSFFSMTISY